MKKETSNKENNVIYGLKKIPISQKRQKISNLFEEVSNDYDKMNDIMSLGSHRIWKKDLVERISKEQFLNEISFSNTVKHSSLLESITTFTGTFEHSLPDVIFKLKKNP